MDSNVPTTGAANAPPNELRRHLGAVIASVMGLAFSVASLGFTYSIGSFINPLIVEFGWSRQQILATQPLITVAVVLMSAAVGWAADRRAVRQIILGSQLLFAFGFFALARWLNSLTSLYVLYFLLALAGGGTTGIGFASLLSRRFDRQRGLALGIAMSGSGLCGFVVPPYATWAIRQFGWRGGYVALGLLPLLFALPLAWAYLHDRPKVPADAAVSAAPDAIPQQTGSSLVEALTGYKFWFLAVGLFTCSGMLTALLTNLVPLLEERGNDPTNAAFIASSFGVAVVVGRVCVGALIDRFWAPLVGACMLIPAALCVFALAQLQPGVMASVALLLVIGLAGGAEVDLMAYLASRYFGLREYGRIFGGLYIAFALGPGVLVPLFGRSRDMYGSYTIGLYAAAAGVGLFAVLLLALGRYPQRC